MIWTADYTERKRHAAMKRMRPPLLVWCLRRYRPGATYRAADVPSGGV